MGVRCSITEKMETPTHWGIETIRGEGSSEGEKKSAEREDGYKLWMKRARDGVRERLERTRDK